MMKCVPIEVGLLLILLLLHGLLLLLPLLLPGLLLLPLLLPGLLFLPLLPSGPLPLFPEAAKWKECQELKDEYTKVDDLNSEDERL